MIATELFPFLIFVAFSLLASVATVHAECSWVLWSKMGDDADDPSGWRRDDALRCSQTSSIVWRAGVFGQISCASGAIKSIASS